MKAKDLKVGEWVIIKKIIWHKDEEAEETKKGIAEHLGKPTQIEDIHDSFYKYSCSNGHAWNEKELRKPNEKEMQTIIENEI